MLRDDRRRTTVPTRRDATSDAHRDSHNDHLLEGSGCYDGNVAYRNRPVGQKLADRATVVG
jgi:hypothetical protein